MFMQEGTVFGDIHARNECMREYFLFMKGHFMDSHIPPVSCSGQYEKELILSPFLMAICELNMKDAVLMTTLFLYIHLECI
jgi:hypothetical protein